MIPTLFISVGSNASRAIPLSFKWFEDDLAKFDSRLVYFLSTEELDAKNDFRSSALLDENVTKLPIMPAFSSISKPEYENRAEFLNARQEAVTRLENEWLNPDAQKETHWARQLKDALLKINRGIQYKARTDPTAPQYIDVCVTVDISKPENFSIACLIGRYLRKHQFQQFDMNVSLFLEMGEALSGDVWGAAAQGICEIANHREKLLYETITILDSQFQPDRDFYRSPADANERETLSESSELIAMWNYQQLFGEVRDKTESGKSGLRGFSGNAIWFDRSRLANLITGYTIARVYSDRNDTVVARKLDRKETEKSLDDMIRSYNRKLNDTEKGLINDIDRRIKKLEIEKLFDKQLFEMEETSRWPEIARDGIAILNTFYHNSWATYTDNLASRGHEQSVSFKNRLMASAFTAPNLVATNQPAAVVKKFLAKFQDEKIEPFHLEKETAIDSQSEREEKAAAVEVDHLYKQLCAEANYSPNLSGLFLRSSLMGVGAAALALQWNINWISFMVPNLVESVTVGLLTTAVIFLLYYFWHIVLRRQSCVRLRDRLIENCRERFRQRLLSAKKSTVREFYQRVNNSNQELHEETLAQTHANLSAAVKKIEKALKIDGSESDYWRITKVPQASVDDKVFQADYVAPTIYPSRKNGQLKVVDFEDAIEQRINNALSDQDEDSPQLLPAFSNLNEVAQSVDSLLDSVWSILHQQVSFQLRDRYNVFTVLNRSFESAQVSSVDRLSGHRKIRDFETPETVIQFLQNQTGYSYIPSKMASNSSTVYYMPGQAPNEFKTVIGGQTEQIYGNPNLILYFRCLENPGLKDVFSPASKFKDFLVGKSNSKSRINLSDEIELKFIELKNDRKES